MSEGLDVDPRTEFVYAVSSAYIELCDTLVESGVLKADVLVGKLDLISEAMARNGNKTASEFVITLRNAVGKERS